MAEMIGVTGGIGAGKSTVLEIVRSVGCRTLDCDAVAHRLYEAGQPLVDVFVDRWGPQVRSADGSVCRQAVAEEVFDHPDELSWLNRQVHPAVKKVVLEAAARPLGHLFCAIPLLYEAGWDAEISHIWVVWCDKKNQRQRLLARGMTRKQINQRLDNQMSMDEKLDRADCALINTGSRTNLENQIRRLLERPEYRE